MGFTRLAGTRKCGCCPLSELMESPLTRSGIGYSDRHFLSGRDGQPNPVIRWRGLELIGLKNKKSHKREKTCCAGRNCRAPNSNKNPTPRIHVSVTQNWFATLLPNEYRSRPPIPPEREKAQGPCVPVLDFPGKSFCDSSCVGFKSLECVILTMWCPPCLPQNHWGLWDRPPGPPAQRLDYLKQNWGVLDDPDHFCGKLKPVPFNSVIEILHGSVFRSAWD